MTYTPAVLQSLQIAISQERLARYLRAAKADSRTAIEMYRLNLSVSEMLYGVLHAFEVTLRNSMHDRLRAHFNTETWYMSASLDNWSHNQAIEAEQRCRDAGSYSVGKVIAELNLAFWTSLTSRNNGSLWDTCLCNAFPHADPNYVGRKKVHAALSDIKRLRNRVAHHDRILGGKGQLYIGLHPAIPDKELTLRPEAVLTAIGWICTDTAKWVEQTTRYATCLTMLNSPLAQLVI